MYYNVCSSFNATKQCHQAPPMKCVLIYMQLFRYAVNSNYFLRFLFSMRAKYDRDALCFEQHCKSR